MAELPRHQALSDATGDAFRSSRLDKMLSNFAASYKLYWLKHARLKIRERSALPRCKADRKRTNAKMRLQ